MTVIVLLGAPGAGKGTQAPALAARIDIPVLASGELLRAAVAAGTPLGREADRYMSRGQLVPDDTMVRVFLDRLAAPDAVAGAILDGFPRTPIQAAGARRGAGRGRPAGRPCRLHRRPARGPRQADGEPPDLHRQRPRLQPRLEPAGDRTACATSTARASSSAPTTRSRRSVPGWPSRCRRSSTWSSTTVRTACSRRSTAGARSTT